MDNAPILAGGDGFDDDPPPEPREGWLLVRVHVPELNVFKCLQFPSDRLVWDVKQQVLASLPKVNFFKRHDHPIDFTHNYPINNYILNELIRFFSSSSSF